MFDLNEKILADFLRLTLKEKCSYSQVLRTIFQDYGEISPPILAHYFEKIYAHRAMEFMPALGAWWHDSTADISDSEFDRQIGEVLNRHS
jgi:hypothetical protein